MSRTPKAPTASTSERRDGDKMRAIAIKAMAANAGENGSALDVLCFSLSGLRSELLVAQSALFNIGGAGWESFEVLLIHTMERASAIEAFAAECVTVEWKQQEGGAS